MSRKTLVQHKMSLKDRSCLGLKISVHEVEKLSLEQIRGFIAASEELRFESENRAQRYASAERVLAAVLQGAVLRRYVEKMTGMSQARSRG
jgi:nucleoside diphosphate kinase